MAKSVVPICTMSICNNKYILGQNYNTLWTVYVMVISWIFWILACVARFTILFHLLLSNVSSVSNILPRYIKLALLYKVLLRRLVWLTDFLDIQSPKGDIYYKRHEMFKKIKFCVLS